MKILFLITLLFSTNALAEQYSGWKVSRIIDGDTVQIENPPPIPSGLKLSVRIKGIDTPEKGHRAKCRTEAVLGLKATRFTAKLINNADSIVFSNLKWGKYGGRVLADVTIDGSSLADELLRVGLAKEYHGSKKPSWCD